MKVKFTKNGDFAMHPARGPFVTCVKGSVVELKDAYAQRLINHNWATDRLSSQSASDFTVPQPPASVPSKQNEVTDDVYNEIDDDSTPPWERANWDAKNAEAKAILEQYARDMFGIEIDRRKSVDNIIKEMEEL